MILLFGAIAIIALIVDAPLLALVAVLCIVLVEGLRWFSEE